MSVAAPSSAPEDPLDRVFAALADPIRRDIVARLAAGEATVGQLAEPYDVSVQAVSKHLKVLEAAGIVVRTGCSPRSPRRLDAAVFDTATAWIERYRRAAERRYRRLDAVLAREPHPAPPTVHGRTEGNAP